MSIKMPNMIITTLAIIAVVAIFGFWNRSPQGVADGAVGLQVALPLNFVLRKDIKTLPLPVILQILNKTNSDSELTAKSSCHIFRFIVITEDNELVQGKKSDENCDAQPAKRDLAAGATLQQIEQIPLDTARYRAGKYKVRVKFWNYEGSAALLLTSPDSIRPDSIRPENPIRP